MPSVGEGPLHPTGSLPAAHRHIAPIHHAVTMLEHGVPILQHREPLPPYAINYKHQAPRHRSGSLQYARVSHQPVGPTNPHRPWSATTMKHPQSEVSRNAPYGERLQDTADGFPRTLHCRSPSAGSLSYNSLLDPHLKQFFVNKFHDPQPPKGSGRPGSGRPGSARSRLSSGGAHGKQGRTDFLYKVTVITGDKKNAGTDAKVYIRFQGTKGKLPKQQLNKSSATKKKKTKFKFKRASTHTFKIHSKDIGELKSCNIEHDGLTKAEGWFLDRIEVVRKDPRTGHEKSWVFMCKQWLSLHEGDCQLQRQLFAKSSTKTEYEIVVVTGNQKGAGTDANVSITLYGRAGSTPKFPLKTTSKNMFERNRSDIFHLKTQSVGPLQKIRIEHDNTGFGAGWFLDRVVVSDKHNPKSKFYFPCGQWLAKDEGDGSTYRDLLGSKDPLAVRKVSKYKVTTFTGDKRGAGTDANVSITLFGESGESGEKKLDNSKNNFEKNKKDEFTVECPCVGPIKRVRIGHDNSGVGPGWYLDKVIVDDLELGKVYEFPCQRWFSLTEDDGCIARDLIANVGPMDAAPGVPYTINVMTGDVTQAGTSARVYIKMFGGKGGEKSSGKIWLEDGKFDRARTDIFNVQVATILSPLSRIEIGHDDSGAGAGWFLDRVMVNCPSAGMEQWFICNKWLATDEGDGLIERTLYENKAMRKTREKMQTWFVWLNTSDIRGAGTDANVHLVAYGKTKDGEYKKSDEVVLDNKGDNFEQGQMDKFKVEMIDIGKPYKVRVGHDNAGSYAAWHLDKLELENMQTKRRYVFKCGRWLAKDEEDGAVVREMPAEGEDIKKPQPLLKYNVSVHTGKKRGAGTDANVFLNIFGEQGDTGERALTKSSTNKNKFEKGNVDEFTLEAVSLKKLKRIRIGHDGTKAGDGWFLEKVVIAPQDSKEDPVEFECNRWLDIKEDDGLIVREITAGGSQLLATTSYHVSLKTGDVRGAGTDANVTLKIFGDKGDTGNLAMQASENSKNKFERGRTDLFKPEASDIGKIQKIRIGHDGAGAGSGWFLDEVRIDVPSQGDSYVFACHRWLDKKEGDGLTEIELEPTEHQKGSAKRPYEVTVWTGDVKGAGTDANVFLQMYGEYGKTEEFQLRNRTDNFEQGEMDKFKIEADDIGPLLKIRIGHDGAGMFAGWFLDKILIQRHLVKGSKRRRKRKLDRRKSVIQEITRAGANYDDESDDDDDYSRGGKAARARSTSSGRRHRDDYSDDERSNRSKSVGSQRKARYNDDNESRDGRRSRKSDTSRDGRKSKNKNGYDSDSPRSSRRGTRSRSRLYDEDEYSDQDDKMRKGRYNDDNESRDGRRSRKSDTSKDGRKSKNKNGYDSDSPRSSMRGARSRSRLYGEDEYSDQDDKTRQKGMRKKKGSKYSDDEDSETERFRVRPGKPPTGKNRKNDYDESDDDRSSRLKRKQSGRRKKDDSDDEFEARSSSLRRKAGAGRQRKGYSDDDSDDARSSSLRRKNKKKEDYDSTAPRRKKQDSDEDSDVKSPRSRRKLVGGRRKKGDSDDDSDGRSASRKRKQSPKSKKRESDDEDDKKKGKKKYLRDFKKEKEDRPEKEDKDDDGEETEDYWFVCNKWFAKNEDDGLIVRELLPTDENGKPLDTGLSEVEYTVSIYTGDVFGAGTDANVFVNLSGEYGDTGERQMKQSNNTNKFERNQEDQFVVTAIELGRLKKLKIRHDNKGGGAAWFLGHVEVTNSKTNETIFFPCQRWLSTNQDDGQIARELVPVDKALKKKLSRKDSVAVRNEIALETKAALTTYHVYVHTGDKRGAGTDANVYCTLFGEIDDTGHLFLKSSKTNRDKFERNQMDEFLIEAVEIGELKKLRIGHDNAGGGAAWHLDRVEVDCPSLGKKWFFPCGRWFAKGEDDGKIERDLFPQDIATEEYVPLDTSSNSMGIPYEITTYTSDVSNSGTDADVYVVLYGRDTCTQKVSLCRDKKERKKRFGRSAVDKFVLEMEDVGDCIEKLRIGHDGAGFGAGWHLGKVEIRRLKNVGKGSETFTFTCDRWLARSEDDGAIERELVPDKIVQESTRKDGSVKKKEIDNRGKLESKKYVVEVFTGDVRGAGTDANVFCIIFGDRGDTGERKLHKSETNSDKFERGQTDRFIIEAVDLGRVYKIKIRHDNSMFSPDWFLDRLEVTDTMEKEKYIFHCERWLGKKKDDGKLERSLYAKGYEGDRTSSTGTLQSARNYGSMSSLDSSLSTEPFSKSPRMVRRQLEEIPEGPTIPYTVKIVTGSEKDQGTESNAWIKIMGGKKRHSGKLYLELAQKSAFLPGSIETFSLEAVDVEEIKQIELGHDGVTAGSGWFVKEVEIDMPTKGKHYYFTCNTWLARDKGDGKTSKTFIIQDGQSSVVSYKPMVQYEATIVTGDVKDAGTDAAIVMRVSGENGTTSDIKLDKASDRFERARTDFIKLEMEDIAPLKKMRLTIDGKCSRPEWFLEMVTLRNMDTGDLTTFKAGKWFSKSKEDGKLSHDLVAIVKGKEQLKVATYKLTVKTSDVRGAGTDANVYACIFGSNGDSGDLHLKESSTNKSPFQNNQTDVFTFPKMYHLGELTKLRVWHDNKGLGAAWHLNEIEVEDSRSGKKFLFHCNRWLSKSDDDKQICRELACANLQSPGAKDKISYEIVVTTTDKKDAGMIHHAWLILEGEERASKEFVMENSTKTKILRRGQTDVFTMVSRNLGSLERCIVGAVEREDKPLGHVDGREASWHCYDINVTNKVTGDRYSFPCKTWIPIAPRISPKYAKTLDVGEVKESKFSTLKSLGTVKYEVTVITGDVSGAGTDANVFINIYGTNGDTGKRPLTQKFRNLFERKQVDKFQLEAVDLGDLTKIQIEHDNSGFGASWFLERVEIHNMVTDHRWMFPCATWLDKKKGDGLICRELLPRD